jgi:hypothetical protein
MMAHDRRRFLASVGQGMLVASVGSDLMTDLGLSTGHAAEGPEQLKFGDREPMVGLMQDTPADKLVPILIDKIARGVPLQELVAAGALANARTFGGLNYEGHHCFAALMPSLYMARELSREKQALPVLKVLHRNTHCIQESGGRKNEALQPVAARELPREQTGGDLLRDPIRKGDRDTAERTLAGLTRKSLTEAYNDLQYCVHDEIDVHRVVLSWRSWETLDVVGKEHALTLLRQSLRFCVRVQDNKDKGIRTVLPKLLECYKLIEKRPGTRKAEDAWIERLSLTIYKSTPVEAAEVSAAALAEGIAPEDVGEAISLAANRLLLCDTGRVKDGSVHGNSVGVHASDAANAWRNISRVTDARNTFASLIVAAYQTTIRPELEKRNPGALQADPIPLPSHLEKATAKNAESLLRDMEAAIEHRDQFAAAALVQRYGELKLPERPVFDLLLRYACSEDGDLHAEKYYRTATEEFATTRPAFRWRQLVSLARVTASEYGHPARGYVEAMRLLKM